ncbi:MAG: Nif3-like dinuclear metal center hexameric protein [Clostridia bacterium]|nr:Nif3-like dinuclear metal center hexameric protein [Clostridia bacterium]
MTARELFEYFRKDAHWVKADSKADDIRFGDENTEVIKVGCGWSDCLDNLIAAANDGCNVFISHEVPFSWETRYADITQMEWYKKRVKVLSDSKMVLMNLHDIWDHYPKDGIREGFAQLLGLKELIKEMDYIHPFSPTVTTGMNSLGIYRIEKTTAGEFAKYMCQRIAQTGAPGLCLNGDPDQTIETVAIGVGCHVPSLEAAANGAQLLIDVYDRHFQLNSRIPLVESGLPVITVEHSIPETYAMNLMAKHISEKLGIESAYYHNEPLGKYYTT